MKEDQDETDIWQIVHLLIESPDDETMYIAVVVSVLPFAISVIIRHPAAMKGLPETYAYIWS